MEALTISAANLDTIERNLDTVAKELSGVINNVGTVNSQVNKVEAKVESLNDEVKNLVKEIRETTIITNARQSIMYNNDQIEKKYGYYDSVRRTTESLLEAIQNSNININALINLKQNLLLNNPNYWLTNATSALVSWLLNDRINCEKELHNALKKDQQKTSLFFCMVNKKLDRKETSINWLNKYLSIQNPLRLDSHFITILDLATNGHLGVEGKSAILSKIESWLNRLHNDEKIEQNQISKWLDYIKDHEETDITMPYLEKASPDVQILKHNLVITSSYLNVLNDLKEIKDNQAESKNIDDIINSLIYDYEEKEQIYQKDNFKNQLIIECNGNTEEALSLYNKQEEMYNSKTDIFSLLSNIVIYKDSYNISNETQKFALALIKEYIIKAYDIKRSKLNINSFTISINDFICKTKDGKNNEEIHHELKNHIMAEFNYDDKDLLVILLIINIAGIIGIFITLNNKILSTILIVILLLGNALLFYQLNKRKRIRQIESNKKMNAIFSSLERILAETIDYNNMLSNDEEKYQELLHFLELLSSNNYIKNDGERNISIGE